MDGESREDLQSHYHLIALSCGEREFMNAWGCTPVTLTFALSSRSARVLLFIV